MRKFKIDTKEIPLWNLALIVFIAVLAFSLGSLWTEVRYLRKGTAGTQVAGTASDDQPSQPDSFAEAGEVEPLRDEDHIKGDRQARILLIEYSDLECPFCKRFHPTAQQAVESFKGQLAWVYRHFPLDQLHSKARKEAEATECAAELGGNDGFWKLTDKIYEVTPSNNGLDLSTLPDLAAQIGLDKTKFKACLDSGKYAQRVESDYRSGIKAGVQGTPGNILLDTKTGESLLVPGAVPFEQLKEAIESLL